MNEIISDLCVLNNEDFRTNSKMKIEGNTAYCQFIERGDTHLVSYMVENNTVAKGVKTTIKLDGWDRVSYVAFGSISSEGFHHIKVPNVIIGEAFDIEFLFDDLIFTKVNCQVAPASINGFKWFIKGTPSEGKGYLEIKTFSLIWNESEQIPIQYEIKNELTDLVLQYLKKNFRDYKHDSLIYLSSGDCPMPGRKVLKWSAESAHPAELESVNTFRFAWHGLHLPASLLIYGIEENEALAIYSAKTLAENWIRNNLIEKSMDAKFTWYDHGTAERLLFFLLLWDCGQKYKFEYRFTALLASALQAHIRLLNSEAFYAYNQPSRYHNHAWFQDLAVIAAAVAFENLSESKCWLSNALRRFEDQLKKLIVRDSGYAIFVENSIGYHHGVQRLAECIGQLVEMNCPTSEITQIAKELVKWSEFFRYPDDRTPAQGDTFRLSPRIGSELRRGMPFDTPSVVVLETAGYAVIKGNHENKPFVICFMASSLCKTHKHEDNLSFTLWFDGIEWLVDPSFYSHEYSQELPSYLRSACAHNCISIPGRHYTIEPGNAKVSGAEESGLYSIKSKHTSYKDIIVSREINGELEVLSLKISDCVSSDTDLVAYLNHHVSENVLVTHCGQEIALSHADSEFEIVFSFDNEFTCAETATNKKVVGLGFMQSASSDVVRHKLRSNRICSWKLFARKKHVVLNMIQRTETLVTSQTQSSKEQPALLKIGLIGSCVSRDFISKIPNCSVNYYARTSFISLNAPKISLPPVELNIPGNFEKRMVQADLDKSMFETFKNAELDCILIDFIDERFDIIKYSGSYFTRSNYLVSSGFLDTLKNFQTIRRGNAHELWYEACGHVCSFLKSIGKPIILNKVWWAEHYKDSDSGNIVKFNEPELALAKESNLFLSRYYNCFQNFIPDALVIEPEQSLIYSDFAHKWGRDFFHFSDEYYEDVANKFLALKRSF